MNGRVYDPILGRFISADPIIQDPTDLQSLNRYTYVRNNPLSMTDPSGFSWLSKQWKKWGKDLFLNVVTMGSYSITKSALREFGRFARKNKYVAEIVQIAGCAAITISTGGAGAAGCAALSAAVTYGVIDGVFKAAITAGAIAFITVTAAQGIGASGWGIEGKVLAHGLLGGTMSVAQGGKFGAGFAAGAFGKLATFGLQSANMPLYQQTAGGGFSDTSFSAIASRTTIAAIMGGTASELSGGTFANGARTGAMQHLFNAESKMSQMSRVDQQQAAKDMSKLAGQYLDRAGDPEKVAMYLGLCVSANGCSNSTLAYADAISVKWQTDLSVLKASADLTSFFRGVENNLIDLAGNLPQSTPGGLAGSAISGYLLNNGDASYSGVSIDCSRTGCKGYVHAK